MNVGDKVRLTNKPQPYWTSSMYKNLGQEVVIKRIDGEYFIIEDDPKEFIYSFEDIEKISPPDYWKQRCLLSEKCLEECPCDPDITQGQRDAWDNWEEFIKKYGAGEDTPE